MASISTPANGKTNHNPDQANAIAMPNDTVIVTSKNMIAPRGEIEQLRRAKNSTLLDDDLSIVDLAGHRRPSNALSAGRTKKAAVKYHRVF
jgi:hypothetical protein